MLNHISTNRKYIHIIFELIAILIVCPILTIYLTQNWKIIKWFYKLFFTLLIIFTIIVDGYLLYKWFYNNNNSRTNNSRTNNNNTLSGLTDKDRIKILLRQSARYSHAARQDNDQLIALLHANYGTGYLWALKDIYPDTIIAEWGFNGSYRDFKEFERTIVNIQDNVNTQSVKQCPMFVSHRDIVSKMGGEG